MRVISCLSLVYGFIGAPSGSRARLSPARFAFANRLQWNDLDMDSRHLLTDKPLADHPTVAQVGAGAVSTKPRPSPVPSRNPTVRRRVREMAEKLGYGPTAGDLYALTRWAHLFEVWRRVGERMDREGVSKADGEPRKLLAEWRALSSELSRLEAALGLVARDRAALGVDIARLHDLASLMSTDTNADWGGGR